MCRTILSHSSTSNFERSSFLGIYYINEEVGLEDNNILSSVCGLNSVKENGGYLPLLSLWLMGRCTFRRCSAMAICLLNMMSIWYTLWRWARRRYCPWKWLFCPASGTNWTWRIWCIHLSSRGFIAVIGKTRDLSTYAHDIRRAGMSVSPGKHPQRPLRWHCSHIEPPHFPWGIFQGDVRFRSMTNSRKLLIIPFLDATEISYTVEFCHIGARTWTASAAQQKNVFKIQNHECWNFFMFILFHFILLYKNL